MSKIAAYYAPWLTRLLRKRGVRIWQVERWRYKADPYCIDIDGHGYPTYIPLNKILTIDWRNSNGELVQEIFNLSRIEAEEKAMSEQVEKLAKRLYKDYRRYALSLTDLTPAAFPRWRDVSVDWKRRFMGMILRCMMEDK